MIVPTLESERLTLRGWRESDLDGFASIMADEAYSRFIGGPLSRDAAWRGIALFIGHWSLRGFGHFALEDKSSGAFVGYCGPWFPFGFPEREIGWALVPSVQGKGYATEAARRVRDYAYGTLGWSTAISLVAVDNAASRRVAERLGARLDGTTEYRGRMCQLWRHPPP